MADSSQSAGMPVPVRELLRNAWQLLPDGGGCGQGNTSGVRHALIEQKTGGDHMIASRFLSRAFFV